MCLQTVFSDRKKRAFLKTQPDSIRCWKVLGGGPKFWRQLFYSLARQPKNGLNTFRTNKISLGVFSTGNSYTGGTHVFKWKKDAREWAGYLQYLVPTVISKKDITTIGAQDAGLLVLVASKAKFNLSKAERA